MPAGDMIGDLIYLGQRCAVLSDELRRTQAKRNATMIQLYRAEAATSIGQLAKWSSLTKARARALIARSEGRR